MRKRDDARALSSAGFSVDSFDPYWKPDFDKEKKYDTIYCNYVLNVLEEEDRNIVIKDVLSRPKTRRPFLFFGEKRLFFGRVVEPRLSGLG